MANNPRDSILYDAIVMLCSEEYLPTILFILGIISADYGFFSNMPIFLAIGTGLLMIGVMHELLFKWTPMKTPTKSVEEDILNRIKFGIGAYAAMVWIDIVLNPTGDRSNVVQIVSAVFLMLPIFNMLFEIVPIKKSRVVRLIFLVSTFMVLLSTILLLNLNRLDTGIDNKVDWGIFVLSLLVAIEDIEKAAKP